MDLDRELWRLGIPAKTRHNEVAPGQFEMAPVYEPTSVGSDHNMVVMSHDAAPRAAARPDVPHPREAVRRHQRLGQAQQLVDGAPTTGENLLDPGNDPHANAQFLAFLVAVIRGVNVHADLLRASIADAGKDHRLGANEAPPAIMSIFLGSQLEDVVDQLEQGRRPRAPRRAARSSSASRRCRSCRRTPPTATGPRRSPSPATSSSSAPSARRRPIYWPQTVLNTAVADSLKQLADELDKLEPGDFEGLTAILSGIVTRQQAGPVRGQRLLRGVARRGGQARPAQQPDDRRRAAGADHGQGQDALLELRRPVRARARLARRDQLGALRQGQQHRGELRRSTSPGR